VDISLDKLSSIDFNGNDRKLIHDFKIGGSSYILKYLNIYDRNLHVYNPRSNEILKVSTDGLILNKTKIIKDLTYMKIIYSSRQPNGTNKCINSDCTHLCLPNQYTSNKFKCFCPEEQYLLPGEMCQIVRYYIKHL